MSEDLEYLARNSIHLVTSLEVFSKESGSRFVNLNEIKKNRGCYASNGGMLCFVTEDGEVYITSSSIISLRIMKDNGLREGSFDVPFSNGEEPIGLGFFWRGLVRKAHEAQSFYYEKDALQYSDKCGYCQLDNDILDKCYRIPNSGVEITTATGEKKMAYPIGGREELLDSYTKIKMGHYCESASLVTFVYRDGHTYVTPGDWIIPYLENAGYKSGTMKLPIHEGDRITDDVEMTFAFLDT